MMHRLAALLVLGPIVLLACQSPEPEVAEPVDPLAAGRAVLDVIDESTLREPITVLSSDEYGGRGPSSEGDLATQQYLASRMEAMGLEPGGDGGAATVL